MQTNELKKGDFVILANGWKARIEDNKKGVTRLATVYGIYTEMGSVYAHDIVKYIGKSIDSEAGVAIDHTDKQLELKKKLQRWMAE